MYRLLWLVCIGVVLLSCAQSQEVKQAADTSYYSGADWLIQHSDTLKGKRIGLVANHSSVVNHIHLLDTLIALGVDVVRVFSPEHGFRGTSDAGESVRDGIDIKTGIPIISLYGKNYKPKPYQLDSLDLVLFDLQDVGVRFYTYLSTMHFVMEACAENELEFWVLDKANPHAHYVDGPVMETKYTSFLGKHPVPLVYGMTIGEYAQMINGEGWLKDSIGCNLKVVPCVNYTRDRVVTITSKPSPNLPNMQSIYLYPSLGLFEGTTMNAGRGTDAPFQQYGHPNYNDTIYSYIPVSIPGASKNPKHKNKRCYGRDLRAIALDSIAKQNQINLSYVLDAYHNTKCDQFFTYGFNAHAGNSVLQQQIKAGLSEAEIRDSWMPALDRFKLIRGKYLLYP